MTYEELILTPEYWTVKIQLELYEKVEKYLKDNNLTRAAFADKLGVSKGYVTQVLKGDFDHRISKLAELALAIGYYPQIEFKEVNEMVTDHKKVLDNVFKQLDSINYIGYICPKQITSVDSRSFPIDQITNKGDKSVA